jgi:hypothetical protein
MRAAFLLVLVSLLLPALFARPCFAAAVYCVADYAAIKPQPKSIARNWPKHGAPGERVCGIIEIEGVIRKGDANTFLALLHRNHPYVNAVQLNSIGGDLAESLRIGHAIRDNLLTTTGPWADSDGAYEIRMETDGVVRGRLRCTSACFLIWAAGVQRLAGARSDSGEPRVLGMHRPMSDSPKFLSMPPDAAGKVYVEALKTMRGYLRDMEVPQYVIDEVTDTSSRSMHYLTNKETKELEFPPSIIEPLLPICGPEPDMAADDGSDDFTTKAKDWRHCWQKRLNNFRDNLPTAKD